MNGIRVVGFAAKKADPFTCTVRFPEDPQRHVRDFRMNSEAEITSLFTHARN
jgi:hypothetical protein